MPRTEAGIEPAHIAILPATVADGIAAGEVVDRPAAVVKELAENAIDAKATRIHIRIEAAGQGLIEVADDGHGMNPADLPVAFQRHATSKLRSLEPSAFAVRRWPALPRSPTSRPSAGAGMGEKGSGFASTVGSFSSLSRPAVPPARGSASSNSSSTHRRD